MAVAAAGLAAYAAPAGDALPPNTVQLSALMQELSAQPGFTEAFLKEIQGGKKQGAALLTPALVDELRKVILGKDWQRLDRFPGWTMGRINPTVRVIGHVAGKDPKVEEKATPGGAPSGKPGDAPPASATLAAFLDLGEYALDKPATISLDVPAKGPGFNLKDYVSPLGDDVTRGDGPSPLAATHAESSRLADTLNRLSMNGYPGVQLFQVESVYADLVAKGKLAPAKQEGAPPANKPQMRSTPEGLIEDLQLAGHTVTVTDSRYFANFGHLHYKGQDVMMPFYVDPQIVVPQTQRHLLVPVSHAEYEWHIRGPLVNADVAFYFGIDGHAEWRTMDQLDQAWVMKRDAHTYTGADAVEVTRLNGEMVRAYERLHQAHPGIPFGGYYGFGVCQDEVAAIELKMTGKATLFPNTADATFFTDPRDAEVNKLIRALPKDRNGRLPEVDRVFGSLPFGDSDAELATATIPGLAPDLIAVHDAWTRGELHRGRTSSSMRWVLIGAGVLLLLGVLGWLRVRRSA